jgi:hypothetical protein
MARTLPKTVLVKEGRTIDLECCGMFKLQKGRTYYNDGSTIFDVYIEGGVAEGWLEEAARGRDTIIVSADELLR